MSIDVLDKIAKQRYIPAKTVIITSDDRKAWHAELRHLEREVFRDDLFEEFGVTNHPKAQATFDLAWERGYAAGLHQVYYRFSELVALL
jgi:hypothetical protein